MNRAAKVAAILALAAASPVALAADAPIKVIIDQDGRGPASSDQVSMLMLVQSPKIEVLGIAMVAGDQWVREETAHTLRMLEIAGRTDIKVYPGADQPLINTKEESELREKLYGSLNYKGAWTPRLYHPPEQIPPLAEGEPTTQAAGEHAVDFLIRTIRQYPGEVTIWAGGPLTNIALAIRKDPEIVGMTKAIYMMGGGLCNDRGGLQNPNGRIEFNWWFDPEAARIVLSAPWKQVVVSPLDVTVKAGYDEADMNRRITKADTALTQYLRKFSRRSPTFPFMPDEASVAGLIDPSIITNRREMYVTVDIDRGPGYGQTVFADKDVAVPPWWRLVTVELDLDQSRFYDLYTDLMTRTSRPSTPARPR